LDAVVSTPRSLVPSVVFLRCTVPSQHPSVDLLGDDRMGTGVVVGPHRILTAAFIAVGAERIEAFGVDGQHAPVRRLRLDHDTGLALLAMDRMDLPQATLGTGDEAVPGQPVFVLAAAGEHERKGATGLITSVGPFEAYWEYMLDRAILSTVPNPGLAGAPLCDGSGRVLGLVTLGLVSAGRYSAAVPVDLYWRHREELEAVVPPPPARAWLGILAQALDGGVVLSGTVPDGPAEEAGLRRGDLVLTVDGQEIGSLRQLFLAIQRHNPGELVGLKVLRESAILGVDVLAGDRGAFFA
jgi:S1-C subfamily serine protease